MSNIDKLILEMGSVGILSSIVGLLVGYAMDFTGGDTVDLWPPHGVAVVMRAFTTGAITHFICSVNAWHVQQYVPPLA